MKKILVGPILMLCFAGCGKSDAKADSQTDSDKPESQLTRNQAGRILDGIPEIVKWSNDVRAASGGKAVPVCKVEHTPVDCQVEGEQPAWIFKFERSYRNRTELWQRFRVDAVSENVTIWNPYKGKFVPLTEWRDTFRH